MPLRRAEPARELTDSKTLLLDYLDYYRAIVADKLDGMSETELRTSRLPSGDGAPGRQPRRPAR